MLHPGDLEAARAHRGSLDLQGRPTGLRLQCPQRV